MTAAECDIVWARLRELQWSVIYIYIFFLWDEITVYYFTYDDLGGVMVNIFEHFQSACVLQLVQRCFDLNGTTKSVQWKYIQTTQELFLLSFNNTAQFHPPYMWHVSFNFEAVIHTSAVWRLKSSSHVESGVFIFNASCHRGLYVTRQSIVGGWLHYNQQANCTTHCESVGVWHTAPTECQRDNVTLVEECEGKDPKRGSATPALRPYCVPVVAHPIPSIPDKPSWPRPAPGPKWMNGNCNLGSRAIQWGSRPRSAGRPILAERPWEAKRSAAWEPRGEGKRKTL